MKIASRRLIKAFAAPSYGTYSERLILIVERGSVLLKAGRAASNILRKA